MSFKMEIIANIPGLEKRQAKGSKYDEVLVQVAGLTDGQHVKLTASDEKEALKLANAVRSLGRKRSIQVSTNQRGADVFVSLKKAS